MNIFMFAIKFRLMMIKENNVENNKHRKNNDTITQTIKCLFYKMIIRIGME